VRLTPMGIGVSPGPVLREVRTTADDAEVAVASRMRRYPAVVSALVAVFVGSFLVVEGLEVPLLADPLPWLRGTAGGAAAAVGVGLLVADVALPVPSSLVMVAHGALFGVVAGTLLSLAGSMGAAVVAFGIGRGGGSLLERLVPDPERRRADALLERWGPLAIVASRPVPVLAETVAILAGASSLGWGPAMAAAAIGSLPAAFVYALTGAVAASVASTAIVFTVVLATTALLWWLQRPDAATDRAAQPADSGGNREPGDG